MANFLLLISNYIHIYTVKLSWILILLFFGKILLGRIVNRFLQITSINSKKSKYKQRAQILASMIVTTGNIVIYFIVLLMILDVFDVDIRPILASAGVIGLAVGFGAQTAVKDFISGLFIILENQYTIGDKVKIGSYTGTVEKVNMRSTVLRDEESGLVFISNSSVKDIVNYSRKKLNNQLTSNE